MDELSAKGTVLGYSEITLLSNGLGGPRVSE